MRIIVTVISLPLPLLFATWVNAQTPLFQEISLKGKLAKVTVSPKETNSIIFFARTAGNSTQPFSISVTGPAGIKLSASMAILKVTPLEQLSDRRAFWTIPLESPSDAKERAKSCITFSPGETTTELPDIPRPESNSPLCDLFSEDEMRSIGESLSLLYGGEWGRAQVCGYLVENYFGGAEPCDPTDPECIALTESEPQAIRSSAETTLTFHRTGLIRKDACASPQTKYILAFKVDLSNVNSDIHPNTTVTLQAIEYRYTGEKASSIKPTSDGRFAPQPIALMTFLGTLCGQRLEIVKWAKRKPRVPRSVLVADLIPYKGRILNRSPLGGLLNGGRASFDLSTTQAGYGVCFELIPRRQKVHGY